MATLFQFYSTFSDLNNQLNQLKPIYQINDGLLLLAETCIQYQQIDEFFQQNFIQSAPLFCLSEDVTKFCSATHQENISKRCCMLNEQQWLQLLTGQPIKIGQNTFVAQKVVTISSS